MGFFIAGAFNPKPVTNTADRQWLILDQSGFIIPSHGLSVPTDTPNQPARPTGIAGDPGNFTVPRFGWPAAYYNVFSDTSVVSGYIEDAAVDMQCVEWVPNDLSGVVGDCYGALWPFGSKMPIAPTASTGAPYGLAPLIYDYGTITPCINALQMHSGNGLPFGLGGRASGFGHMLSMDGVVLTWGGPVPALSSPAVDLGINVSGIPGASGANCVRDFKLNPNNSGQFYVLFDSGYVYSGGKLGSAAVNVAAGTPQADGGSGITPGANVALTRNGWRWMHVEWGEYIVIVHTSGDTWGLRLTGGTAPIPAVPSPHPPWWVSGIAAPYHPGWYRDGAMHPPNAPAHFWQVAITGEVHDDLLAGVVTLTAVTATNTTTTTRPTITWNYSDSLGVTQKSYNVRVYPIGVTTAAGFTAGQNQGAAWVHDVTSAAASNLVNNDLINGAQYKAYVRVKSAADVQSAWVASSTFTMAIPLPTQPSSCTTVLHSGTYPTTFGTVDVTAGGSLPANSLRQFQVSAGNGSWENVIGAEATASATVVDNYPPTNINLTYRVRTVKRVPAIIASDWRLSADTLLSPATNQPPFAWYLIDVEGFAGTPTRVQVHVRKWEVTDRELAGEFDVLTRSAVVKTTAGVKGTVHNVTLTLKTKAEADSLAALLRVTRPLLFETQYGYRWWVSPRPGTWSQRLVAPTAYSRDVDIELVEVVRP